MRPARTWIVEVGALVLFAILFGLVGATMFGRAPAPAAAPLPAPVAPNIPPGREDVVMTFLRAFGPIFAGHALGDTRIEKDEIRVQLVDAGEDAGAAPDAPCAGPAWVRAPGGLRFRYGKGEAWRDGSDIATGAVISGELILDFFLCGPDARAHVEPAEAPRALDRAQAAVQPTRIWTTSSSSPAPSMPPLGAGLLAPAVAVTGIAPAWIAVLAWVSGFALALVAPLVRRSDASIEPEQLASDAASPRVVSLVAAALAVAGIAIRVRLAMSRVLDGDEPWAFPTAHPVFTNDHDAWVHPPLFRALQGLWGATVGWHPGDALLALRAPSVVASSVTVGVVALVSRRVGSLVALLPLAVVALSPVVAGDGVLARPYGLAAAFTVVVAAASSGERSTSFGSSPARVSIALVAFGAAIWTDLLAGVGAATVLALAIARPGFGWRARAAVAVVAAVWALPLVGGAIVALGTQVTPAPLHPGAAAPDLGPVHGMGHGAPLGALEEVASFAVFGVPFASLALGALSLGWLVALAVVARRAAGGARAAAAPLVVIAILALVATRVGLRTRNVLFLPHLAAIAAAAPIGATLGRARRRRRA